MTDEAQTEQPEDAPLPPGVASEPPALMYWTLWISCFAALIYGLGVLFGNNRSTPPGME